MVSFIDMLCQTFLVGFLWGIVQTQLRIQLLEENVWDYAGLHLINTASWICCVTINLKIFFNYSVNFGDHYWSRLVDCLAKPAIVFGCEDSNVTWYPVYCWTTETETPNESKTELWFKRISSFDKFVCVHIVFTWETLRLCSSIMQVKIHTHCYILSALYRCTNCQDKVCLDHRSNVIGTYATVISTWADPKRRL